MAKAEKKKLVLVVDDQERVLRFIEIDLKLRGFEVATATSGQGALELAKALQPDIVLLDIVMPGMDGFEVLKKLRSFTKLPVIAFSASVSNHGEAIRLGASDFISKPFNVNELAGRMKAVLNC